MQKITPCLWFDGRVQEALDFYLSIFPDGKVLEKSHYGKDMPGKAGEILVVTFELAGQRLMILNGGPHYKLSEAFSLSVECKDQAEVDRLWTALTADGGEESMCGWLKDRFGVSWQIVPSAMKGYVGGPDKAGAQRAMQAMMQMRKLDVETLRRAYEGAA